METHHYLTDRPLGAERLILRDLHALNRQFLTLLLRGCGPALDGPSVGSLSTLGETQLERLAECPYSLFDLKFANAAFWRNTATNNADAERRLLSFETNPECTAFVLAALLYARQLAATAPDLARLLLGIPNDTGKILRGMTLPALAGVALSDGRLLSARLAQHPHFWTDLMNFVRDGSSERYLAAKTLGVQQLTVRIDDVPR